MVDYTGRASTAQEEELPRAGTGCGMHKWDVHRSEQMNYVGQI